MELTKQQQQLIDVQDKNVLVSASAGSGKTFILIEKVYDLISTGKASLKDLLVVTFTNAAANEMKKRLDSKLKSEIKKNFNLVKEIEYLKNADICTFDSFCSVLLKKYFYKLEITPNFIMLSEDEQTILKKRSFKLALQKIYNEEYDHYLFLYKTFHLKTDSDALYSIISKLNNFFNGNLISFENVQIKLDDVFVFINNYLCDKANVYNHEISLLQTVFQNFDMAYCMAVSNEISSFLSSITINKNFFENIEVIKEEKFSRMPRKKIDYNFIQLQAYEKLKNLKTKISKNFTKLILEKFNYTYDEIQRNANENNNILKKIVYLYNEFITNYKLLKKDKNALDFDDLEQLTLTLLSQNPDVTSSIKSEKKYIFVDEYQDTSTIQEKIISYIQQNNNLVVVGDVKQSIYRFRKANPSLFISKFQTYSIHKDRNELIKLNENFRSNPEILKFCNKIFDEVMTDYSSKIDYKQSSEFNTTLQFEKVNDFSGVNLISYEKINDIQEVQLDSVYDVNNHQFEEVKQSDGYIEATILASKIVKLLQSKIYDIKRNTKRKVRLNDISVLVQGRGTFYNDFLKRLDELTIPYKSAIEINLFSHKECRILVDLIKLTNNFNDDITLLSILYSCFGNFTHQEILEISNIECDKKFFYEKLFYYKQQKSNILQQKIDDFIKFIANFRSDIEFYGIQSSLKNIIEKYHFIAFYTLKLKSLNVENNVNKLLEIFNDEEINKSVSLFLNLIESEDKKVVVDAKNDDAINILTIHKSKGLEYPIVFLVGTDTLLFKPNTDKFVYNEDLGMSFIYDSEVNFLNNIVSLKEKQESFAEKLRLLYVALTRSKNHLFIIGEKIGNAKELPIDVFDCKNFSDIINYALQCSDNGDFYTYEKFTKEDFRTLDNENNFIPVESKNITKIIESIRNRKENNISLKNTVTNLNKNLEMVEFYNDKPKKLSLEELSLKNYSKTEIGNTYHEILEKLDFDKDIISQLDELVSVENPYIVKEKIIKIVCKIKEILSFEIKEVLKEKTFIMNIKYNDIFKQSNIEEKILVQGKLDLLVLGEKNIIIDYKYSSKDNQYLINTYKNQLNIYKIAVERAYRVKIDKLFLINIKNGEIIDLKLDDLN